MIPTLSVLGFNICYACLDPKIMISVSTVNFRRRFRFVVVGGGYNNIFLLCPKINRATKGQFQILKVTISSVYAVFVLGVRDYCYDDKYR